MLRVGLTGGLATGKSLVGEHLARLGCHWIQADELGHEVLSPAHPVYEAVVREFGGEILCADGSVDRKKLGAIVFDQPDRLALLNSLIHQAVIRREEELIAAISARNPDAIVVLEAAILIETGSFKRFDRLILTVCDEETQVQRAMKRSSLSREEVLARLRRQMPLVDKLPYADFVIDTSGPKEETQKKVAEVYRSLRSMQS